RFGAQMVRKTGTPRDAASACLSPPTLTQSNTQVILHATAGNICDRVIYSLPLGTGRGLAEIVGLEVGDVFAPDTTPRSRVGSGPRPPRAAVCPCASISLYVQILGAGTTTPLLSAR